MSTILEKMEDIKEATQNLSELLNDMDALLGVYNPNENNHDNN